MPEKMYKCKACGLKFKKILFSCPSCSTPVKDTEIFHKFMIIITIAAVGILIFSIATGSYYPFNLFNPLSGTMYTRWIGAALNSYSFDSRGGYTHHSGAGLRSSISTGSYRVNRDTIYFTSPDGTFTGTITRNSEEDSITVSEIKYTRFSR